LTARCRSSAIYGFLVVGCRISAAGLSQSAWLPPARLTVRAATIVRQYPEVPCTLGLERFKPGEVAQPIALDASRDQLRVDVDALTRKDNLMWAAPALRIFQETQT
jgi:hypothetical protein